MIRSSGKSIWEAVGGILGRRTTIGMSVVFGLAVAVLPVLGFPAGMTDERPGVIPEEDFSMAKWTATTTPTATPDATLPEAPTIIGVSERVKLSGPLGDKVIVAKIDTGANHSSIDKDLARALGMIPERSVKKTVRNAMGVGERQVVKFKFVLAGREISTTATIADRSKLSTPMIIGKSDLGGFLIDPSSQFLTISGPVTEPR